MYILWQDFKQRWISVRVLNIAQFEFWAGFMPPTMELFKRSYKSNWLTPMLMMNLKVIRTIWCSLIPTQFQWQKFTLHKLFHIGCVLLRHEQTISNLLLLISISPRSLTSLISQDPCSKSNHNIKRVFFEISAFVTIKINET